jgi:hypothetical protein
MSSAIAIWAAAVATADAIARIIAILAGAATPGRALRTTGEAAADRDGTAAAADRGPGQVRAGAAGRAAAGATAR